MATPPPASELSSELVAFLKGMRPVAIATVDDEGWPQLSVISWVWAVDGKTIRVAMDARSRTVASVAKSGRAVLQLYALHTSFQIKGICRVVKERMESVSFPQAMLELSVAEVRENFFFGSQLDADPTYSYTYKPDVAADLDAKIYAELKAS